MIASIILLLLGTATLDAVCLCKAAGEADRYMEKLERREDTK